MHYTKMGFLNAPWVSSLVMFLIALVLLVQSSLTINIAKADEDPTEKSKKNVRYISILTLVVCVVLILYVIVTLTCTYTPLSTKGACSFFNKKVMAPVKEAASTAVEKVADAAAAAAAPAS